MTTSNVLKILFCLFFFVTFSYSKRGFILTAPKAIDAGSTEYFTFTAFDVPPGGVVSLKLLHWYTGSVLAESEVNVLSNMNMWVEMDIPAIPSVVKAKLFVQGNFSDGYRIISEKEVLIRHNSVLTFVQTDKPLYKPGQTVRFRILPMDSQLKPLGPDTVGDVWIEDPSNIRVAQWRNVQFKEGMKQLELPLSSEPPLGIWSIKTSINDVTATQSFNVEKYVLPKFDVTIKPPSFIMANAETIPVEICAWYSYGKKVDGKLKVKVTYVRASYENDKPSVEHSGLISGCHTFVVNTQDIMMQNPVYGLRILEFFAEVVENGTEIAANATTTKRLTHSALLMKFLGTERDTDYFKPGIPFYGQLQVQTPDGEPAPSEKIEICADFKHFQPHNHPNERKCQRFTSNKKGRVRFIVPPKSSTISKIDLMAEAINHHPQTYERKNRYDHMLVIERPHASLHLNPWFSPSGNYLQIQTTPDEMECEKLHRVKVRYTGERGASIKFYHKVISRGRLVQQGSHQRTFYPKDDTTERRYDFEPQSTDNGGASSWPLKTVTTSAVNETASPDIGEFDLSFDPRATMSPVARLLIYYVREDGEVVADSRKFRIAKCLLNKVNLHFRHEQQYPSTEASLLLSATPSSVCGIGLVDKSVRYLKQDNQFKIEKIFEVMEKYDVGKSSKPNQVTNDYCMLKEAEANKKDSETKDESGEGVLQTRNYHLSRKVSVHADTIMAFEEAGMVVVTDFELETRPCMTSEPVAIPFRRQSYISRSSNSRYAVAKDFSPPEVYSPLPRSSKEAQPKTETQAEEIRNFFPETWLWEMHTVGLSGETALRRQLPHTITQWVGGAVCVHPKSGLGFSEDSSITAFQPFFVAFRLPYSVIRGEVLPLVVTVFNYLSECLPIKLSLEQSEEYRILSEGRSHKMCVCGGQSAFHKFVLKPTALGQVNVTVYGYSLEDDDEVCGNDITARLSARDAVSKQLKVEAEGFPKEEVYNYYICPKNTNGSYAIEVDFLPPEDVVEGSARAYASISGDLMAPAMSGLDKLVRLPTGCGEQNMVLFTPNIFVLDYLMSSGKQIDDIKEQCIKNMKTGYQRELMYRHKDGSYSAFGTNDKGGSLWLTAFVVRSFGQARRFIEIDDHDLRLSTNWILENQFENGCFQPTGFLIHKGMKGGLTEAEQSLAPLTAYVLIALLESGVVREEQEAVQNALKCLEEDSNPGSYAIALYAYSSALAKEKTTARNYLRLLDQRVINRGGFMYWESGVQSSNSKAVNVEIAGYYILARIELDDKDSAGDVLPVVKWMARQRNSNGGFVSTQDTVVALQALARYESIHTEEIDMGLVVETDGLVKGFKLNEQNKLVTQTVKIPEVPAVVDLQAVGDGCALVQFTFRYNVERISGADAFDINVDALRVGSLDCNLPRIGICMRYKIPDQASNMVVVLVKMASGFTPDEWSLYALQSDPDVKLKRHEIDGNSVNLYFDELTNEQMCFKFYIKNEMEVEDIKPSTISIYDYYQPELQVTKDYTIPSACTVPELPELPRLPPLIIDTEEDIDDKNKLGPNSPFRNEFEPSPDYSDIEMTPESSNATDPTTNPGEIAPTATEKMAIDNATLMHDTLPNTIAASTETIGLSDDVTGNLDNATTSDFQLRTVNAMVEDVSESNPVTSLAMEDGIAMADDANSFWTNENEGKFSNFIDSEHDLDFPDGIEGNVPVFVLPPTANPTVKEPDESIELDCPICSNTFPDDFSELFCGSSFVLRAIVRDGVVGTVKILQELSSSYPHPKQIKKFATLEYDNRCDCSQLYESGNTLVIVGANSDLWRQGKGKHRIRLTRKTYIISTSSKAVQPPEVKRAKNSCTEDP